MLLGDLRCEQHRYQKGCPRRAEVSFPSSHRGLGTGCGPPYKLTKQGLVRDPRPERGTGAPLIGWLDIFFRLGAAVVVGCLIGLNRELHNKPTGMRTLGLVALGSALAVLAVAQGSTADASRVIQGVITGIGFLGAGVILHRPTGGKVHGLTTAASIWVTASLGILCGLAAWKTVVLATILIVLLLISGGPLEHRIHRFLGDEDE